MIHNLGGNSLSMTVLRVWMWLVPFVMLVGSVVFGAIAANDGNWALVAVMVVIGVTAIGLLYLHYWVMYRFGKNAGQEQ
jgi:membrane protein YdbS with pleckstrin-like domain